jgi:hypothetical protein
LSFRAQIDDAEGKVQWIPHTLHIFEDLTNKQVALNKIIPEPSYSTSSTPASSSSSVSPEPSSDSATTTRTSSRPRQSQQFFRDGDEDKISNQSGGEATVTMNKIDSHHLNVYDVKRANEALMALVQVPTRIITGNIALFNVVCPLIEFNFPFREWRMIIQIWK